MDAQERHIQRIEQLTTALDRLMALHGQIYDLQAEIVALNQSQAEDRVERVKALHEKVRGLWPEIERAKRELAARKPN
jgi:hypothetical protein